MASRISLEPTVLNSGEPRHFRQKDFASIPRLQRTVRVPSSTEVLMTRRISATRAGWLQQLYRALRLG